MTNVASDLRDLAAWVDHCVQWIERVAEDADDHPDRAARTVGFEAATLNEFLIGFRRLSPELERLAQQVERPRLRLVNGGRS